MKLKKIHIDRGYSDDGPLKGTIEFSTPAEHKITVKLSEEDAIAIIQQCAEAVARAGKDAAEALTADMLRTTAIEHQPEE